MGKYQERGGLSIIVILGLYIHSFNADLSMDNCDLVMAVVACIALREAGSHDYRVLGACDHVVTSFLGTGMIGLKDVVTLPMFTYKHV